MKACSKCKKEKNLSEFYIDGRNGKAMAACKACKYEQARKWVKSQKGYGAKRYKRDKENNQNRHLKRKYGITLDDYYKMLRNQGSVCAICGAPEPDHKKFDVDHCHKTGKVRGLLCTSCNRMLGHAGDKVKNLLNAAEYLKQTHK